MESKLTYKQKVELAEWIADMNDCAITGSLMLKRRGIDLGREPDDIDIVISRNTLIDDIILPPFVEKKEEEIGYDGYEVLARFWVHGTKVEFLQDDFSLEKSEKYINMFNSHNHNVRYCLIEDLIRAKKEYIEKDENADYINKSIKDLEIIEKFQSQFPIIRYEVLFNGHLSKLECNGMIDNNYRFIQTNLMHDVNMFDEWRLSEDIMGESCCERRFSKLDGLYISLDEAMKVSKKRWYKNVCPSGKYVVREFFDDHFEGYVTGVLSAKEAYKKVLELNITSGYLYHYDMITIENNNKSK